MFAGLAMVVAYTVIYDVSIYFQTAESIPINFGNNSKAQLAAKTVFGLAHRHGDILREGWKNILDCLMQLYRAKLLPDVLVQVKT